jgi:hypothetical protein
MSRLVQQLGYVRYGCPSADKFLKSPANYTRFRVIAMFRCRTRVVCNRKIYCAVKIAAWRSFHYRVPRILHSGARPEPSAFWPSRSTERP